MRDASPASGPSVGGPEADRCPPLPEYAAELARELGRAVRGDVDFGPGARALYAYDASVFRQVPVGVVTPRDAEDVAAGHVSRDVDAPAVLLWPDTFTN
jgi:hypothetical protein